MRFTLDPFALTAGYVEGVLPLVEVKAHLSIAEEDEEFDSLVRIYAAAAVDQVERYCEIALAPKAGRKWRAEVLPDRLVLPGPNVVVTGLTYFDSSGESISGDANAFRVTGGGELVPKRGQSWPSDMDAGIEITFSSGFAAGECPPTLKQAGLMFAAHLFANREAVRATGTISGEIPLGFRVLCAGTAPVLI